MPKDEQPDRRPFLKILATMPGPLVGAEIGVWRGDNAARILACGANILYLVDTWRPYIQDGTEVDFSCYRDEAVKRFTDNSGACVIQMESTVAAKGLNDACLDFVYIDACHTYESVKADIAAWLPKVKRGGYIAGHDFNFNWAGVTHAVLEAQRQYDWDLCTRTSDWWAVVE